MLSAVAESSGRAPNRAGFLWRALSGARNLACHVLAVAGRSGGDHRRRGRRRLHAARRAVRRRDLRHPGGAGREAPLSAPAELRSTPPAARAARRRRRRRRAWRWCRRGGPRGRRGCVAGVRRRRGRRRGPSRRCTRPAVPPAPVLLARHRASRALGSPRLWASARAAHQSRRPLPASVSSLRACAPRRHLGPITGEHHVEIPNRANGSRSRGQPPSTSHIHHRATTAKARRVRQRGAAARPVPLPPPVLTALRAGVLVVAAIATMIVVKAAGDSGPSAAASSHLTAGGSSAAGDPGTTALSRASWPRCRCRPATLDAVGSPASVALPSRVGNGSDPAGSGRQAADHLHRRRVLPLLRGGAVVAGGGAVALRDVLEPVGDALVGLPTSIPTRRPSRSTDRATPARTSTSRPSRRPRTSRSGAPTQTLQTPTAAQSALLADRRPAGEHPVPRHRQPLRRHGCELLAPGAAGPVAEPDRGAAARIPPAPVAQAIDGTANDITAAISSVTGNQPAGVASSADHRGDRPEAGGVTMVAHPTSRRVPGWVPVTSLGLSLAAVAIASYLTVAHYTDPAALACPDTGIVNCALGDHELVVGGARRPPGRPRTGVGRRHGRPDDASGLALGARGGSTAPGWRSRLPARSWCSTSCTWSSSGSAPSACGARRSTPRPCASSGWSWPGGPPRG